MEKEIMLLEDICHTLNIGKTTAYSLIQSGRLPARKIGGKWQIRRTDFENFVAEYFNQQKG